MSEEKPPDKTCYRGHKLEWHRVNLPKWRGIEMTGWSAYCKECEEGFMASDSESDRKVREYYARRREGAGS